MTYRARHTYDALPSSPDARDYRMRAVDIRALPDTVSLPNVPPLDQGAEGSCVGHGCAGARETLELIVAGAVPMVPLSRAFIYYRARLMEHSQGEDSGAEVRDGCRVLAIDGVPTEDQFPYRVGHFADVPPDAALEAAASYRIGAYTRLANTVQVRAALASNQPVVIGISVYQSFEQAIGADGHVPIPANGEALLGGHCMFLWGYHPDPRNPGMYLFDGQNSWGPNWADNGHFHMPQDYLDNGDLCTDLWAISL